MYEFSLNFLFKAVGWGIDGTLADSEPVHKMSFQIACDQLEVTLPDDFHAALLGKTDLETYRWLVDACGLQVSLDTWLEMRLNAYMARLNLVKP